MVNFNCLVNVDLTSCDTKQSLYHYSYCGSDNCIGARITSIIVVDIEFVSCECCDLVQYLVTFTVTVAGTTKVYHNQ